MESIGTIKDKLQVHASDDTYTRLVQIFISFNLRRFNVLQIWSQSKEFLPLLHRFQVR